MRIIILADRCHKAVAIHKRPETAGPQAPQRQMSRPKVSSISSMATSVAPASKAGPAQRQGQAPSRIQVFTASLPAKDAPSPLEQPAVAPERAAQHDIGISMGQSRRLARIVGRLFGERFGTERRQAGESELDCANGNAEIAGDGRQALGTFPILAGGLAAPDVFGACHGYSMSRPS